jgi:glycosyltransferase involved in cell wall biosynthesis
MGEGYLQRKFPRSADRIEARYLGVEIPPQEAPRSTDGILRVVSCGFVEPIKRTDRIEEALTRVKRRVHWTHFGDGSLFPALSAAVRTLPPHVSVDLKGFRPNREVIDFYSAQPVDLFLNLSSMEGIPVAIMEAMSFGIPCLATAVGGTPELVGTGNGYLVPSDPSPGAIASILDNHAIDSPEKRRAARATIEERFNAARNFAEFAEELQEIARRGVGRP